MPDIPKSGRQGRRFRRELARQMAKELVKNVGRTASAHKRGGEALWALASVLIPLGWNEIMSGEHAAWRVIVGWCLWVVPIGFGLYVFWQWSTDANLTNLIKIPFVVLAMGVFATVSGYSIWNSLRESFLFVWPGLPYGDGTTIYYYAAERRQLTNSAIVVLDTAAPGNDMSFRITELDPQPGGFANSFRFKPANPGHEKLNVILQSKDSYTSEELTVRARGPALFPAYRAIVKNSFSGKVIFQCQDRDFPEKAELPDCGVYAYRH
jgi:hypothetical protein